MFGNSHRQPARRSVFVHPFFTELFMDPFPFQGFPNHLYDMRHPGYPHRLPSVNQMVRLGASHPLKGASHQRVVVHHVAAW